MLGPNLQVIKSCDEYAVYIHIGLVDERDHLGLTPNCIS